MANSKDASNGEVTLSIAPSSLTVTETDSNLNYPSFFTITLNRPSTTDITLSIAASSTLATSPGDYTLGASTITIPAGSVTATVALEITGDTASRELDKIIHVDFTLPAQFSTSVISFDISLIDNDPLTLTVEPYFSSFPDWNDYFVTTNKFPLSRYFKNDTSVFPTSPTACTKTTNANCWNGGEMRKVVVSDKNTCSNLSMVDSENAFTWRCQANGIQPVFFYSVGFNKGKGLSNFINATSDNFKNLSVTLSENSTPLATSTLTKWWNNSFFKYDSGNINSSGGTRLDLNTTGRIYTFVGNITSMGINITADKVAMVVMPGSKLISPTNAASTDCDALFGGVQNCFIKADVHVGTWLEGNIDAGALTASDEGITLNNITGGFADYNTGFRWHNFTFKGVDQIIQSRNAYISDGTFVDTFLNLDQSYQYKVHDIKASGHSYGIITQSQLGYAGYLFNIDITNTYSTGIRLYPNNYLNHYKITNSSTALALETSDQRVSDGFIAGQYIGVKGTNGGDDILLHTTIVNSAFEAINDEAISGSKRLNTLLVNNSTGVKTGGANKEYHNLFSIDNTQEITVASGSSNFRIFDDFFLGNGTCEVNAGTNVGIVNTTCAESGGSNFDLTSSQSSVSLFNNFSNDASNAQGASGFAGIAQIVITDFFNFDNSLRSWIKFTTSSPFPNGAYRGQCSSGQCKIFDFSIHPSSPLKNNFGTFVENAPCPDSVKGSVNFFDGYNYALKGAMEIMMDGYGNDDGLCQANEKCYFNPAPGGMLKDVWNFTKTCTYDPDGTALTGITIYGE